MAQESIFTPSIWPTVKTVVVGIVMSAIGVGIVQNGIGLFREAPLFMILGIALVIVGPVMTIATLFGKRGGYGPCPVCQVPLEASSGFHLIYLANKRGGQTVIPQTQVRHILLKP